MFKIGEFSKFCFVTIKTLRYYDKIGLLTPARVDESTGYRYYSAEQVSSLNRILALKDLGLTLEQIGSLADGDLSTDQVRGMLRLRQAELCQQMEDDQSRLAQVEWRLQQIDRSDGHLNHDIVVKETPEQRVASIRDRLAIDQVIPLFGEMYSCLRASGLSPAGPLTAIYHDEEFPDGSFDVEIAVPVEQPIPEDGRMANGQLPRVETMACVIHEGSFETLGRTYQHLLTWMAANRYGIAGPIREVHLQGPPSCLESKQFVTELQLPVEKLLSEKE